MTMLKETRNFLKFLDEYVLEEGQKLYKYQEMLIEDYIENHHLNKGESK